MAFIRIPDLPLGGSDASPPVPVNVNTNLLVLEQDITRKIRPLNFLTTSIPQFTTTTDIVSGNLIPISNTVNGVTKNLTVATLLDYINKNGPIIHEVYYVSCDDVNASDIQDTPTRGRNEELPYRTIKRAAKAISDAMAAEVAPNANGEDFLPPPATKKQYSIMVRSGDYAEKTPIFLPPNTSMIGDNLRRTTIRPFDASYDKNDMFWVSSACYIWGFTFRGHKSIVDTRTVNDIVYDNNTGQYEQVTKLVEDIVGGSAAIAFPVSTSTVTSETQEQYNIAYNGAKNGVDPNYRINPAIVPATRPVIYTSPYVQGCTSYSVPTGLGLVDRGSIDPTTNTWGTGPNDAGTGMRIDGSLVDGYLRSMVLDSFTQVNQGGRGVVIKNHGYAQFVSIFTVATKEGVVCESGGSCSISTSNSTFGLSGLIARGKSPEPILQGTFTVAPQPETYQGNIPPYGFSIAGNLFTINNVTPLEINPDNDQNRQIVANYPYTNMCFTVGDDNPWGSNTTGGYIKESDINLNGKDEPKLFFVEITPRKNTSTALNSPNAYDILLNFNIPLDLTRLRGIDFTNAPVRFYARSMIETGSHTFEYMGTGTRMFWAIPSNGGVANNNLEAVFDAGVPNYRTDNDGNIVLDALGNPILETNSNLPGIVFYTSSNELGDFKVGPSFKILQSTGTIDGDTFKRAILTLVTPLNIVLE
jgi:hypothetical protein